MEGWHTQPQNLRILTSFDNEKAVLKKYMAFFCFVFFFKVGLLIIGNKINVLQMIAIPNQLYYVSSWYPES